MNRKYVSLYVCVWLFLVGSAIDWLPVQEQLWLGKVRFLLLGSVPLLFYWLSKKLHWAPALFTAYVTAQFIFADYPLYGILSLLVVFGTMFLAIQLKEFVSTRAFGLTLVYLGVFQSLIAIPQRFGYHFLLQYNEPWAQYMATGTVGQNTRLGVLLLLAAAPALWLKRYFSFTLIFACSIAAESTMTSGGLVVVGLFYLWFRGFGRLSLRLAGIFGPLAVLGAFLLGDKYSFFSHTGRVPIWQAAWKAFLEEPIWGQPALGYWNHVYVQAKVGLIGGMRPAEIHSDWLQLLVGQGLVLGICMLVALGFFLRNLKPTWQCATVAAILVNALANMPFQLPLAGVVVTALWAYCMEPQKSKTGGFDAS